MAGFQSLPPELVANIWGHLDIYDFASLACTSKANYEALKVPTVLAHYLVDRYGTGALSWAVRLGIHFTPELFHRLLQRGVPLARNLAQRMSPTCSLIPIARHISPESRKAVLQEAEGWYGDKLFTGYEDDRIIRRLAEKSILTREEQEIIEELIEKYCYLPLPRTDYMTCMALILGKLPHLCISAMCNGWDPTESNQDLVFRPHLGFGMRRGSSSEADDIASVVTIMNLSRIGLTLSPTLASQALNSVLNNDLGGLGIHPAYPRLLLLHHAGILKFSLTNLLAATMRVVCPRPNDNKRFVVFKRLALDFPQLGGLVTFPALSSWCNLASSYGIRGRADPVRDLEGIAVTEDDVYNVLVHDSMSLTQKQKALQAAHACIPSFSLAAFVCERLPTLLTAPCNGIVIHLWALELPQFTGLVEGLIQTKGELYHEDRQPSQAIC
ncbi:hypothetical protein ACQY0O_001451 [Thecaphora frezii]